MSNNSIRFLLKKLINEYFYGNVTGGLRINSSGNVRFDDLAFQQPKLVSASKSSNVLDDSQKGTDDFLQNHKLAAVCLIFSKDNKILAVSRKDDPSDFGLPGGGVEMGETPKMAAIRELQEETGLHAIEVTPVFMALDSHGFITTTFACKVEGKIHTFERGIVRWVNPVVLLQGSFADYNRKLFLKLGIKY